MVVSKTTHLGSSPSARARINKHMSNDTISERTLPSMRKFINAVKPHVEFGKKHAPEPETADEAGARRTQEVTARANDEKRGYGFLRSLQKRAFGKKEVEQPAPVQRPERSEEERRQAVINRAKGEPTE